jgi:hypothetical protein
MIAEGKAVSRAQIHGRFQGLFATSRLTAARPDRKVSSRSLWKSDPIVFRFVEVPMSEPNHNEPTALDAALRGVSALSRRGFMAAGVLAAWGCASSGTSRSDRMPDPILSSRAGATKPEITPPAVANGPKQFGFVQHRTLWCRGECDPSIMNPMKPVYRITVHHDGMRPFLATDQTSAMARIEMIRSGHRQKGWGDIGYHFVVDRGGRVWEGREIKWQGAHVKEQNEGNIGICCLGNFDEQKYRVPVRMVKTHQEMPSAHTACPGRALQAEMKSMRQSRLAYLTLPAGDDIAAA